MKCKKCSFTVASNMKFAIMKNMCPSCGAPLFSERERNEISMLQNRVSVQNFSDGFDEVTTHDVALFIFNEIRGGLGQAFVERQVKRALDKVKNIEKEPGSSEFDEGSEDEGVGNIESDTSSDVDFNDIKQEIEEELAPEIEAITSPSISKSAVDKVERLKQIHKQSGMANKQGAIVRRVD
jgi:hypothetical protein